MFPLQNVILKNRRNKGCLLPDWVVFYDWRTKSNYIKYPSVYSCLYFVPVLICMSINSSCQKVLIFLYWALYLYYFLFNSKCILNVLLPAYVLFLSLKKMNKRGKKIKFKNIFVVKTWTVYRLFIYLITWPNNPVMWLK